MLLAFSVGFAGYWWAWKTVDDKGDSPDARSLKVALSKAEGVSSKANDFNNRFTTAKTEFDHVKEMGARLSGIEPRRLMWVELTKAISDALPHDAVDQRPIGTAKPDELAAMLIKSKRIEIDSLDCEHFTRLEDWFVDVKDKYEGPESSPAQGAAAPAANPPGDAPAPPGSGPTGEGWVIQLSGHHFHNQDPTNAGAQYVRNTLLRNLMEQPITLPDQDGKPVPVMPKELGIMYPVLIYASKVSDEEIPLPGTNPEAGAGRRPDADGKAQSVTAPRCDFRIQFVWKETPIDKRIEEREKQKPTTEPGKLPATADIRPVGQTH
jgi:hypothetical protein